MARLEARVRALPDAFFRTGARSELAEPGAARDEYGFLVEKLPSRTVQSGPLFRATLEALGPDVLST